ncbi:hypothetical protein niasHT_033820 [Heterodera trifolii]|uniref:Uncharacterized protein n=1 Tax=Heterodera trifolii TaxID=157864 RepID=A0ABD2J7F4_9BILA
MSSLGHHRSRDRERNADARSESVRARSASRHELEEMEKDVKDGLWDKMVLCLRSMVALPPNLDRQSVYPNSSSSIGLALIVNNSRFENRDNRDGTDVDEQNMTKLLSSLGYIVYTNLNETAEQMMSTIRQFSRFGDHAAADSTVIVVLSHGEKDVVLGTDGVGINIHDFASQMNATACPQLVGKPKLTMAYVRVKGRLMPNHQNHVRISHLHVHDSQNQNWSCKCSAIIRIVSQKCDVAGFKFDFDDDVFDNKTKGFGYNFISLVKLMDPNKGFYDKGENKVKLAIDSHAHFSTNADIFIAHSAWPGFVSWRNVQRGTWFVQCICRVFFKRAREDDLLTMMTQVNRMMQDFMSRDEKAKQVPMQTLEIKMSISDLNWIKPMLSSGEYADVHFSVGDGDEKKIIPAHKFILKLASDVFEAMFRFDAQNENAGNVSVNCPVVVEVPDVEAAAFKVMLSFI